MPGSHCKQWNHQQEAQKYKEKKKWHHKKDTCLDFESWKKKALLYLSWEQVCWAIQIFCSSANGPERLQKDQEYWFGGYKQIFVSRENSQNGIYK